MDNKKNNIHIGDHNVIKNSVIGQNNSKQKNIITEQQHWYEKLFWKILIPIFVAVVAGLIVILVNNKL
jgi:hypothetical protein